jgi:hypothetical protein
MGDANTFTTRQGLHKIVLACAAAAAVTAAAGCATGASASAGRHRHGAPAPEPASFIASSRPGFNPLVPYAKFGWLPHGFSTVGTLAVAQSRTEEDLYAGKLVSLTDFRGFGVWVHLAGLCRLAKNSINCPKHGGDSQVLRPAPRIHGRAAYWLVGDGLAWKYSARGWALIGSTGYGLRSRKAEFKVAAGVSFGQTSRPRFPFRQTGVPAWWHLAGAIYTRTRHLEFGSQISVVLPGKHYNQILVSVGLPTKAITCQPGRPITLDGQPAVLTTYTGNPKVPVSQDLCAPDIHGLYVDIILGLQTRTARQTGFSSAVKVFRKLRLFGRNKSHWTRSPLS